jgi:hypothetical protein
MQPSNIFIVVHVQNIYIYRWIIWSSWWVMWRFTYITRGIQKHLYMSLYMHINLIYLCKLSFFKKENHGDLVLSIDFTVARRWLQSAFWWNWLCDMSVEFSSYALPASVPTCTGSTLRLLCFWHLWKHRYGVVFNGIVPSLSLIRKSCRDDVVLWRARLPLE